MLGIRRDQRQVVVGAAEHLYSRELRSRNTIISCQLQAFAASARYAQDLPIFDFNGQTEFIRL